jgi:PAS domain S-box-containing protein
MVVDRERRIAYLNRPLPGRQVRRMLGTDLCDHLPVEHCDRMADVLAQVFRTAVPGRYELPVPDERGGVLLYEAHLIPVLRGRRVVLVLITATDVTERRRGEAIQAATRLISEAAHTSPTLEALFSAIHGIVSDLMPARNFYIALYDASSDLISFPYLVDEFDVAPPPKKPGRGLTDYVLRSGQPLLVTPGVMRELERRGDVELIGADSVDWLGVPLKTDGRTIGVLVVQSYTEGVRYSETDRSVLQFVSTQVAMTIERKRAEAALRASEEQYRRLVEVAPDLIAVHSEGKIVFMNPAGLRLLGARSPEDVVGKPVLDFVHPDSRPAVIERVRAMTQHGQAAPLLAERFLRLDGTPVHVEVAATPVLYRDRPAVQVVVHDIGERMRTEAALRESEEKFRSFIESTTDWVWSTDRDGVHTYSNPAVTRILGYTPEEVVGRSAFSIMHPDDRSQVEEQFAALAAEGRGWRNLVIRWRCRDGSHRFLESSAVPILGADGRLKGYRGVDRDITERVKAEEALRNSEVRLSQAQSIAHLGIWELDLTDLDDLDRNALWWWDETYRIFGYPPRQVAVTNELFFRAVHPDDAGRVRAALVEALRGGRPYLVEHRIVRPDGSQRVVREQATLEWDAQGRPLRMMGTVLDVTEQRRLEDQLRQAQKMEAVGQLAGGVAHDFNNLLTTILASHELLAAGLPADGPHREDLDTIRQAARRAAELTSSLLAFSRQQALELRALSLGALLSAFVRMARRVVPEDVEVVTHVETEESVVRADPIAVEQMLMNLVTNARDAMPGGGSLSIAVGRGALDEEHRRTHGWGKPGEYVILSVSDTGLGMDRETVQRIFEPFFTTKPVGQGTGLGMAMVYGLVKQHEGYVSVYSERGRGTTVRIYFPAVAEEASELSPPETSRPVGGRETILLVEDDASLRRTATRVLERHGYTVVTATDGFDALDVVQSRATPPDLIISDVVMPRASGPQLLAALRDRGAAPRMLFTSGYTARDVHDRALLEGDVPFLAKPWTIVDLLRKVREVLDQPHAG